MRRLTRAEVVGRISDLEVGGVLEGLSESR